MSTKNEKSNVKNEKSNAFLGRFKVICEILGA
jgi:hypothetical protein